MLTESPIPILGCFAPGYSAVFLRADTHIKQHIECFRITNNSLFKVPRPCQNWPLFAWKLWVLFCELARAGLELARCAMRELARGGGGLLPGLRQGPGGPEARRQARRAERRHVARSQARARASACARQHARVSVRRRSRFSSRSEARKKPRAPTWRQVGLGVLHKLCQFAASGVPLPVGASSA